MSLLPLVAAVWLCLALFKPSQPRRKQRRPVPDEDVWFILSQL
jgi:hypothetical protein